MINVRSYWPSVVASGALLVATDALSSQRTLGTYMLSACDFSKSQLSDFARLQGSAESLVTLAVTYDGVASQLLKQRIFNTSIERNVSALRQMILNVSFAEACNNLTHDDRTELSVTWGDQTEVYILTIDDIRENYIIHPILEVRSSSVLT